MKPKRPENQNVAGTGLSQRQINCLIANGNTMTAIHAMGRAAALAKVKTYFAQWKARQKKTEETP